MKYIEYPELARLAQALTHEGPECSVHTRIEAYSCKNVKRDKKLFKSLEHAYNDDVSNSPPFPSWLDREPEITPFGPMDKQASRKTLYLLIATLNVAFPDHEFSDVRPAHFSKEKNGASVLNSLSTTLLSPHRGGMPAPRTYSAYPPTSPNFFPSSVPTTSSSPPNHGAISPFAAPQIISGTHPTLYRILDEIIGLHDCEVFSYAPDTDSDPHANDFSDDEDDVASVADEDSSDGGGDDATFEFDDYDVDESMPTYNSPMYSTNQHHHIPFRHSSGSSSSSRSANDLHSPERAIHTSFPARVRPKRRDGALLWSSHWFFLNPKLKRILFISVWAHTRGNRSWVDDEDIDDISAEYGPSIEVSEKRERFLGWEGGVGAGARALGLSASV
ncbi:Maf1 regulator-domain-containing protein [Hygrophoropsis aurantiaca]|uniref:Maf1 regulator-domain-containing protein n=1 Tax=Hygrophoropsis aurantiaca TaxID=72124 RepID=A0ACB8AGA2_9AGAM|nr:Maf1 regulator-domain-containing protein [Hygrophoropsis aurantiaca]